MPKPEWPKHLDGTPKKMGELPIEEQRAWFRWGINKVAADLAPLGIKVEVADDQKKEKLS